MQCERCGKPGHIHVGPFFKRTAELNYEVKTGSQHSWCWNCIPEWARQQFGIPTVEEHRNRQIEGGIRMILEALGEDLNDDNFRDTPKRVRKFLQEFSKQKPTPREIMKVDFPTEYKGMVMQKDIPFASLCAHHMLPFRGKAAVAYVPKDRVVGLSKLARIVHWGARRLTLQEDVTKRIADAIEEVLEPKGLMVVIESEHLCMAIRGVKEPDAMTVTSDVRGVFYHNERGTKDEFMQFLKG